MILGALAAFALSAGAAEAPAPPWVRRGQVVEARQAAYRERLRRTYEALRARVEQDAPDALPALASASPRPVRLGYQILPRLVEDAPRPSAPPAARPRSYSWPWTEQM